VVDLVNTIIDNPDFDTMSLQSLPSDLPSQLNGSDTYRKEEPESFHNNKGYIAD
jgi:hypothetical protein